MSQKLKALCILTELLGNRLWSYGYRDVLDSMDNIEPTYLFIGNEDYRKYRAPGIVRLSSAWETIWVVRKKYQDLFKDKRFDVLFINGVEFVLAFKDLIAKHPTVLSLDATLSQAHKMLARVSDSPWQKVKSFITAAIFNRICRRIFREIEVFLPFSHWCAKSLKDELGVPESKILVTLPPLDLGQWPAGGHHNGGMKNLLFVGSDFRRKGGPFLLNLHQRHFKYNTKLTIITSPTANIDQGHYENVEIFQDIPYEIVIKKFSEADIFVFPSHKDYLGAVLAEADAAGLPSITRDVGGAGELILDNYSGFVLDYESSEQQWADKIRHLLEDDGKRKEFGRNARLFAEKNLSLQKFRRIVKEAVELLARKRK